MFGSQYRRESGAIIIAGTHVASTQQCVHCGSHEMILRGSGKKRGLCTKCGGFVCGRPDCMMYCIPYEAQIEWQEATGMNQLKQIKKLLNKYPNIAQITI